jgi:hypothetical protein
MSSPLVSTFSGPNTPSCLLGGAIYGVRGRKFGLKILLDSGIIEDERIPEDARVRLFKLQPDSLVAVQAFLDQLQAEWRSQLRSFKRHVESKPR